MCKHDSTSGSMCVHVCKHDSTSGSMCTCSLTRGIYLFILLFYLFFIQLIYLWKKLFFNFIIVFNVFFYNINYSKISF